MKNVIVINSNSNYLTFDIIEHLQSKNINVLLFTRKYDFEVLNKNYNINGASYSFVKFYVSLIKYMLNNKNDFYYFLGNPPFLYFLCIIMKRNFGVLVWDLYPHILVLIGVTKKNILYKVLEKLNIIVLKKSKLLHVISKDMFNYFCSKGIENVAEVCLWPNYNLSCVDNGIVADEKSGEDYTTIHYSGNVGRSHPIELVLDLAKKTKKLKIKFYIAVKNKKLHNKLKNVLNRHKIKNVFIIPYMTNAEFRIFVNSIDFSLVLLDDRLTLESVPSKLYNLLYLKKRVIAICNKDSTLYKIISDNKIGLAYSKDRMDELINQIYFIKNNNFDKNIDNYLKSIGEKNYKRIVEDIIKFYD